MNGLYRYSSTIEGDLTRFSGEETIDYDGNTVYRMVVHGSRIGRQES